MANRRAAYLILLALLIVSLLPVSAQSDGGESAFDSVPDVMIEEMEFRNQGLQDVLLSLARLGSMSVIFDDTVTGSTTHFFSDVSLAEAFAVVASSNNLFLENRDGVWHVSRISSGPGESPDQLRLFARDVRPEFIVEALARQAGITILFDPLPAEEISINVESLPVERILKIVLERFPDYELDVRDDYFYIKYNAPESSNAPSAGRGGNGISRSGEGLYSVNARGLRFSELLRQLFELEGREYALMKQGDSVIDQMTYSDKGFTRMLELLLEQAEAGYSVRNDIYYILDVSRNDILRRFEETRTISLSHIKAESLPSLFPSGMISSSSFKIDREHNSIILNGLEAELEEASAFIARMDRPIEDKNYHRFDLINARTEDVIALLPDRLKPSQPIVVPGQSAFIMLTSPRKAGEIEDFIRLLDADGSGVPVRLRYLKSEQLLENLPPSVSEENILQTADPTLIFFQGGRKVHERFMSELEHIDKPIPQIRYQLLVIQFQNTARTRYEMNASNSKPEMSEGEDAPQFSDSSFIGFIGNLLQLDFDIVSNFGYNFAVDLNWDMTNSQARILADTTLTGLSGEEVDFQNTNTFRYRDNEVDPDTGEVTPTGVTREIVSGLFLKVNGWSSGDEMITMDISTTVSKQGSDLSNNGNPPPTSERIINSHIRTQSGEPVIIGGLVNQEADTSVNTTPLLGQIPLIGKLFTQQQRSLDDTELMIYIIPHLEYAYSDETPPAELFARLYAEHMEQ